VLLKVSLKGWLDDDYINSCNIVDSASFLEFFGVRDFGDDKSRIIIFLDEFDELLKAESRVRSEVLKIFHCIRNSSPSTFAIHSTIAIGTFSILHINSDTSRSPFNIINSFQNPYLTLNQVEKLYEEFAEEMDKTIDKDVIKDIYVQTNGYVKLI